MKHPLDREREGMKENRRPKTGKQCQRQKMLQKTDTHSHKRKFSATGEHSTGRKRKQEPIICI